MTGLILGFAVSLVTFPGIIVHELAHQFFCWLLKVPVFEVCYFRIGKTAGFVRHERPKSPWASLLIAIGPAFVNTLLGVLIAFPAVLGAFLFDSVFNTLVDLILIWLGLSIAMHAFPSIGDAKTIWNSVMDDRSAIWVKLVGAPVVGFIFAGAVGSFFWFDAIYGLLVIIGIPYYMCIPWPVCENGLVPKLHSRTHLSAQLRCSAPPCELVRAHCSFDRRSSPA